MVIDAIPMEKCNRMEFEMRLARHVILKEIKNGCKNNFALSPLSLHAVLNLVASGSTGRILDIGDLNAQSSQMMTLVTTGEEFLESENTGDLNYSQSSQTTTEEGSSRSSNELQDNPSVFGFSFHRSPPFGRVGFGNRCPFSSNGNAGSSTGGNQGQIISFVNGIWVDHRQTFKPSFKQVAEDIYKAKAENVDFLTQAEQVRNEVNLWAKKAPKGLINDLLPVGFFNKCTILVLANAISFKGTWLYPFDPSYIKNEDFHLLSGGTVKAPFKISYTSKPQFYGSFEGFKILKLPYKSGQDNKRFSMYIFLPDKKDGLQELIQQFNSDSRLLLNKRCDLQQVELSVMYIPKLKFSYEINTKKIMKELGLTKIFENSREITEIVDSPELYVSDAIHKSYIEVNEEGTIATAVTVFGCA
ncbi:hypothetical protein P3X46_021918, partial [Hevea brasiliensis]